MKVSDVSTYELRDYLRQDPYDTTEDTLLLAILSAAKSYIISYTGQTAEYIDTKEDITIAFMVLCADMYVNREYTVTNDKVNQVVKSILNMYCLNLIA